MDVSNINEIINLLVVLAIAAAVAGFMAGLLGVGGGAERAEDLVELVDLAVSRPEGPAVDHLGEDDADRPHVDGARVLLGAEEDLRRAVPQRDDLVCVRAQRHGEGAREAKVGEFESACIRVDEHVLRLEFAVQDSVRVAPRQPVEQLPAV